MDINQVLQEAIGKNASDLHIIPDYYPTIRINNDLFQLKNYGLISASEAHKLLLSITTPEQTIDLQNNKEIDLGYAIEDVRFRVNIYTTRGNLAGAFRLIPKKIKTIEELNLPPYLHTLAKHNQGLVLITGPTGEGKSTTLSSIINEINLDQSKHIVTIEDPIEFVYPQARSIISQREIHHDTHSFNIALRSILREDPDIVLIGEMRDYETMQAAMTIAETGHLVFSTLHTSSSSETINRIIDVFPNHQQNQIKSQLSAVLLAIIGQRLLPTITNQIRIPALEILTNNSAIASLIRDGKTHLIDNVITTSAKEDMILFEKYLSRLYKKGDITKETALTYAIRPKEFDKFILEK